MTQTDARAVFEALFAAAVAAADPTRLIAKYLPKRPLGRTVVVGAGKGSAQMARALEAAWGEPLQGLVVTRYGAGVRCRSIEVIEAAHPVPDEAGFRAARRLLEVVGGLTPDDLVIALISGGGSALLPAPAGALSLGDEVEVNRALLVSGAPIAAMNTVRKHVSAIKGGRLAAAAYPAKVVSLVVSDVPGDRASLISSGPTIPDDTTRADALRVVENWRIPLPQEVMAHLSSSAADAPTPDDRHFVRNEVHVIASAGLSLEAASSKAREIGIDARILSDSIEGEARDVAKVHAAIAREIALKNRPFSKPILLLSGGETTVTLRGTGRGGRNTEFLLSFALATSGVEGIAGFAADTDGIDGTEDNAGACADHTTVERLRALGLDAAALLAANNSWAAFDALGDLFVSGPTGTNINDLRAILVT